MLDANMLLEVHGGARMVRTTSLSMPVWWGLNFACKERKS